MRERHDRKSAATRQFRRTAYHATTLPVVPVFRVVTEPRTASDPQRSSEAGPGRAVTAVPTRTLGPQGEPVAPLAPVAES